MTAPVTRRAVLTGAVLAILAPRLRRRHRYTAAYRAVY